MNRGNDNVRRRFTGKLNDVFAEVGFNHLDSMAFQRDIQVNLFGHHAFAFNDLPGAALIRQTADNLVSLLRIARPMHLCAAVLGIRYKLFEILVEIEQHLVFDGSSLSPQGLPIGQSVGCGQPSCAKQRCRVAQGAALPSARRV